MTLTISNASAILKTLYPPERIKRICYKNNPFFAMVPKDESFVGENLKQPLDYGSPQGRSATFATAQSNADNTKYKAFTLTRVRDYGVALIANEVIKAASSDRGAFIRALESEMNNMLFSLKRSIAVSLYRNGSGSIGRLSATSGVTTAITLSERRDHTNFEEGMVLVLSTADGGGAIKTGDTKITDINRTTGVITVATDMSTFSAVGAVNDYIFMEGDHDAKISGLSAWIPASAPSATTFFGVDRTADTERLGGVRIAGSGGPIEETLIDAMEELASYGSSPDIFFMNYKEWASLSKTLESKVQIVNLNVDGIVGFRGLRMQGPSGAVDIVPDVNCPAGTGYLLQMDTWKLWSLGTVPHVFDTDGLESLRQATADGVEVRGLYYAQLGCSAPGYNAVITF